MVAALLYFAFRETPLINIWEVIRRLRPGSLLTLVGMNLLFLVLVNTRWWIVLRSIGYSVSIPALMAYRLAGYGLSYVTPGPQFGGESLQVYLLHKGQNIPVDAAITSVYLDRMIDLIANFTFLLLGCLVIFSLGIYPGWASRSFAGMVMLLLVFPTGHLILLKKGKRPAAWLAKRWKNSRFLHIREVIIRSEEMAADLVQNKPSTLIAASALSGLVWVTAVLEFWLCLDFLGISAGWKEAAAALTAARMAFLAPVPGGLGVLETSLLVAAAMLGWGAATGIAVSLVIRARDVLLAVVGLCTGFILYRSFYGGTLTQGKDK